MLLASRCTSWITRPLLEGPDHDIVELRERSRLLEEIRFKMEEESNRHLHVAYLIMRQLGIVR
jgi:hypothetical protein